MCHAELRAEQAEDREDPMRTWHTLLAAASMAVALLAAPPPASAQLRGQSIRIVVPTAAGGAADAVARLMGQRLQEETGTTVLVENKAGGLFAPAMRDVVNSPADGSTIFMVTTSVLMSQILHPEIPYDLTRDYTPIIAVATGPLIMVGRKDLPFRDVAGLVAHAKRNPGKLVFASPGGNGSAFSLAVTLLVSTTGIDALNVPYKSGAPALNDLLGGHVDLMFDAMPVEVGQVQAGNVIGFMVTGPTRVSTLPQVPSAPEAGVPDLDVAGWFGFLAPPKTPAAIVAPIHEAIARSLVRADVAAQLQSQGVAPVGGTPQAWAAYLHSEHARWSKFVADHGIKAE
jgi:tripartite-type tricarboxylate transporter receptor subunit TctC